MSSGGGGAAAPAGAPVGAPVGGGYSPEFHTRWAEYQRRKIKDVLNERYLLNKRVERESFRRALGAVVIFIGYKFVRHRFFGAGDGSKGGM